jgi:hypothetical protein
MLYQCGFPARARALVEALLPHSSQASKRGL